MARPAGDRRKFKELLLYVAQKSKGDSRFGATKLNKVLYFSDFLAYGRLGQPITGVTYQRLDHGPAPMPMLPVQRELEEEGAAELVEVPRFNLSQKRLVPKRGPQLEGFSAEEIALVDEVIEALRRYDATGVSGLSHLEMGWQLVDDREEIPYQYVYLSSEPLTPDDVSKAREFAASFGDGTPP
ncbi:MAG: SocA family protein [Candidatus Dormibacteraeota bacterium]|nr:SocA family protein [Candidatus Dormibacteraeota bacterium]